MPGPPSLGSEVTWQSTPMPGSSGSCRRRSSWKCSTAVPKGQRKASAQPSTTAGAAPLTTSDTASPAMGTRTVWASCRLALASTQTHSPSSPRRQKPKTSSPSAKGSKSPVVRTGRAFLTAMALRKTVAQSMRPPSQGKAARLYGSRKPSMPRSSP